MAVCSYYRREELIEYMYNTLNAAWLMTVLYELQLKEVNLRFRRDAADTVRDAAIAINSKEEIFQASLIKVFNSTKLKMSSKFTLYFTIVK